MFSEESASAFTETRCTVFPWSSDCATLICPVTEKKCCVLCLFFDWELRSEYCLTLSACTDTRTSRREAKIHRSCACHLPLWYTDSLWDHGCATVYVLFTVGCSTLSFFNVKTASCGLKLMLHRKMQYTRSRYQPRNSHFMTCSTRAQSQRATCKPSEQDSQFLLFSISFVFLSCSHFIWRILMWMKYEKCVSLGKTTRMSLVLNSKEKSFFF